MTPRSDSTTDPAGLIFLGAVAALVGLAFDVAFGILYLFSGRSLLRIDSDAQLTVTAGSLMQVVGVVAIVVAVRQTRRR